MKVAVVTPYYQEDVDILNRCHDSVIKQTHEDTQHFMVADGHPNYTIKSWKKTQHIILPNRHNDAGATPRALGAISAFSQGYDAVAFLDVDNTFDNVHIETLVNLLPGHDLVTATRRICNRDGECLYEDFTESDGEVFCDTNCLVLSKNCLYLMSHWIVPPEYHLWSDRNFWAAICQSPLSKIHCSIPTVNYYTRWAWHYQHAGQVPPDDSVWIDKTVTGELIHRRHTQEGKTMQAEIYTKTICPFCTRAKKLLNERGISYQEYIISPGMDEESPGPNQFYITRDVLLEKLPSAKTVPQIWLDGEHVGGYEELVAYFEKNSS